MSTLNEFFLWIHSEQDIEYRPILSLTRMLLEEARAQADSTHRDILASRHELRIKNRTAEADLNEMALHQAFQAFLAGIDLAFGGKEHLSLVEYIAHYLLSSDRNQAVIAKKMQQLCAHWLASDEASALAFFTTHRMAFMRYPQVSLLFLVHRLQGETNPLGIAALFNQWLDDPASLALGVIWLLRRGVLPEDLIATHLLHRFLWYNGFGMASADNPVTELYTVLRQFPEAHALIELAARVSCDDRGFDRYVLTGHLVKEGVLESIPHHADAFEMTETEANLTALQAVFGDAIIPEIVVLTICSIHQPDRRFWTAIINSMPIILHYLPAIINRVAAMRDGKGLDRLVDLLPMPVIEHLIASKNGAVFHLIPYKVGLLSKLQSVNLEDFVEQVLQSNPSGLDTIVQLTALFKLLRRTDKRMSLFLYRAIIHQMLSCPLSFEDDFLCATLERFSQKNQVLSSIATELHALLDEEIRAQIEGGTFTTDAFISIEDIWHTVLHKTDLLLGLSTFDMKCPHNKYALQAYIAKKWLNESQCGFSLDHFLDVLAIQPIISSDSVTEYERLCIELLAAIDDKAIQTRLIDAFHAVPSKRNSWRNKPYDGEFIFYKAVRAGNKGLLVVLEDQYCEGDTLSKGLRMAIALAQWDVVDYFLSHHTTVVDRTLLEDCLREATRCNEPRIIRLLCDKPNAPRRECIEASLTHAVKHELLEVMMLLCQAKQYKPSKKIMIALCEQALAMNRFKIAIQLCSNYTHKELKKMMEVKLIQLASCANVALVQAYCEVVSQPRLSVLQRAINEAIHANQRDTVDFLQQRYADVLATSVTMASSISRRRMRSPLSEVSLFRNAALFTSDESGFLVSPRAALY